MTVGIDAVKAQGAQASDEGATSPDGNGSRPTRRFRWIAVTAAACVALIVAAFVVGTVVRSPSEQAIANAQSQPLVTAKVEQRTVQAATTQVTGTITLGKTWSVYAATSGDGIAVVTATRLVPGDKVTSGTVVSTVSGRPLIALQLPFDLYRDLAGGDSGDDVRALQAALTTAGVYHGAVDGSYGSGTASAVKALYAKAGASAPTASSDAAGALTQAQQALTDATTAAATAPTDQSAAQAVTAARQDLQVKTLAALTPLPRAEIVSLPAASATVVDVAPVNTHVDDQTPVVQLRSGAATVTARIGVGDKAAFPVGASVTVQSASDTQITTTGTVTAVSGFREADPDQNNSLPGYDITLSVAATTGFDDQADVQVTAKSTAGETTGLAVPVTALRKEAGTTYVLLDEGNGNGGKDERSRRVTVTEVMVSDGYALVKDTTLKTGDEVIVSVAS